MTHPFCEVLAFLGAGISSEAQAHARQAREQAQMARAQEEIYHLVEREFRYVLSEFGRDAPMLRRVSLEYECAEDAYLFRAEFDGYGGQDRAPMVRHARWRSHDMQGLVAAFNGAPGSLSAAGFENDCRRIYSRLYEDHLLELDLEQGRRELEAFIAQTTDHSAINMAVARYHEYEAHITRHHRRRVDRPMFVYGEISPDLNIRRDAVNYVTTGALPTGLMVQSQPMTATEVQARQAEAYRRLPQWTPFPLSWFRNDIGHFLPNPDVGDPQAQQRGLELLKANLTPEQLASYEKNQHFIVVGSDTRKRYRIRHGRQMNIEELDDKGRRVSGLCFLPEGNLVAGDCMLAQKIALENSERDALKIANRFA